MCYTTNVNYQFNCRRCDAVIKEEARNRLEEEDMVEGVVMESTTPRPQYDGETSRTPYTRAQDHFDNYSRGTNSFMYDHTMDKHNGEVRGGVEDYEMVVVAKDKDVMRRVLREAIRIKAATEGRMEMMKIIIMVEGEEEEVEIMTPITLLNGRMEWYMPRLIQANIVDL